MSGVKYPHQVQRPLSDILGDRLSALAFGVTGDGVTDDAPAISRAISALSALSGRDLYFPGGRTYLLKTPVIFPSGLNFIRITGDGDATLFKRGADMPEGVGVFNLDGSERVVFRELRYDGDVTTPAELQYTDFQYDPMHPLLTKNTGFWVHGGARDIVFEKVTINHTGGYAILLDAETGVGDIQNVKVLGCRFENNRPHTFGHVLGSTGYGSWTGGFHIQGDGYIDAVSDVLVQGCTFRRMVGNACWSHAKALDRMHTNWRTIGNHFEDCGLDGVQYGVVYGGAVEGNTFRRIGFMTYTDDDEPQPMWYTDPQGRQIVAVALDTAGLVRGVNYRGNSMLAVNGGFIDLDGYGQGTVDGNVCINPQVGEAEYDRDKCSLFGPNNDGSNWTYGIQTNNTNGVEQAGKNVTIANNTLLGLGRAIGLFAARSSMVIGNNIEHPSNSMGVPITIGNVGASDQQRAYNNIVTENRIAWSPPSHSPAVNEEETYGQFAPTDKNWVYGNKLLGNTVYEFHKSANSASITRVVHSSGQPNLSANSESLTQREGNAYIGYLRWYANIANASQWSVMTLLDRWVNSIGGDGQPQYSTGPMLNVSRDGQARTGAYSTGNRLSAGVEDIMQTGKVYTDAFTIFADLTFDDAEANRFNSEYALLRYNKATGQMLMSVSVDSNGRVWTGFGASAAGVQDTVQFNSGGGFAGSTNLKWLNTDQKLLITGKADSAALSVVGATSFISSDGGFFTGSTGLTAINVPNGTISGKYLSIMGTEGNAANVPNGGVSALYLTALGTQGWNTIQAPNGGVLGKYLYAESAAYFKSGTAPPAPVTSAYGGLAHKTGSTYFYYDPNVGWREFDFAVGGQSGWVPGPTVDASLRDLDIYRRILLVNLAYVGFKSTDGDWHDNLYMAGDNNLYLDHKKTAGGAYHDIYIRPGAGRYVMFGYDNSSVYLRPGGTVTGYIGESAKRWQKVWAVDIDFSGTITGTLPPATIPDNSDLNVRYLGVSGRVLLNNNIWIGGKKTGGEWQAMLYVGTDNNVYLDNISTGGGVYNDIYIRPGQSRNVLFGSDNTNVVVRPGLNVLGYLGTTSYRWYQLNVGAGGANITGPLVMDSFIDDARIQLWGTEYSFGVRSYTLIAKTSARMRVESARSSSLYNLFEVGDTSGNTYVLVSYTGQLVGGHAQLSGDLVVGGSIASNRTTGPAIQATNTYIQAKGFNASGMSGVYNAIQTDGGMRADNGYYVGTAQVIDSSGQFVGTFSPSSISINGSISGGSFHIYGTEIINSGGAFVGAGINCPYYGVTAAGFNPAGYTGITQTIELRLNGGEWWFYVGGYHYKKLQVVGGVMVGAFN